MLSGVVVGLKGPKGIMLWAFEREDGTPRLKVEQMDVDPQLEERYRDHWPKVLRLFEEAKTIF